MVNRLTQAVAAALLLGASLTADAAGLGRLTVLSNLGQPFRGEVDLMSVRKEELSSLTARVAGPDAFRQADLPYSAFVSGLKLSIEQRPGGEAFIRITSTQPLNEPFVDFLLELGSASGKLMRAYTALVDPPSVEPAAAPAPTPAPAAQVRPAPAPATEAPVPLPPAADRRGPASPSRTPAAPRPAPATEAATSTAPPTGAAGEHGPVRSGETLRAIARSRKPADVTLEQMLVALFRANPDAFEGQNMNRLRAGRVLRVPTPAEASATAPAAAMAEVNAQAANWNSYRDRLAGSVAGGESAAGRAEAAPSRTASGKVTPPPLVPPPAATDAPRDVVRLSRGEPAKGGGGADGATRDRIRTLEEELAARTRAAAEASQRVGQLEKQVKELQTLADLKGKPGATPVAGMPPAPAKGPAVTVPAGTLPGTASAPASPPAPAAPVKPAAAAASAPASGATAAPTPASLPPASPPPLPAAATPGTTPPVPVPAAGGPGPGSAASADAPSAPAAAAVTPPGPAGAQAPAEGTPLPPPPRPRPRPPVVKAPPPPPSLLDELTGNPLVLGGAALGAVVLGGLGYLAWKRRRGQAVARAMLGASAKAAAAQDELSLPGFPPARDSIADEPPASLPAADAMGEESDPLAEAEVFLIYGRDLQAEERLREGISATPDRLELHAKLLEIYARRGDAAAFEEVAIQLERATGASGEFWNEAVRLGYEVDPGNPRYAAGRSAASGAGEAPTPDAEATLRLPASPMAAGPADEDLDFNLDFEKTVTTGSTDIDLGNLGPSPGQEIEGGTDIDLGDLAPSGQGMAATDIDLGALGGDAQVSATDIDLGEFLGDQPAGATDIDLGVLGGDLPPGRILDPSEPLATGVFGVSPVGGESFDPTATEVSSPPGSDDTTLGGRSLAAAGGSGPDLDLDLGLPETSARALPLAGTGTEGLDFDLGGLDLDLPGRDDGSATLIPGSDPDATLTGRRSDLDATLGGSAADDDPDRTVMGGPGIDLDLSGISLEMEPPSEPGLNSGEHDEKWFDVQTKFDLAKAYQEMGDQEGAREILQEVVAEGDPAQQEAARNLLASLG